MKGSVALTFAAVFTGMSPKPSTDVTTPRYKRHRFSAEIIAHAVWLYFRFPLSLRHVEDLLADRGIEVSFQTVAKSAAKVGREYARSIRRRTRGSFADKWHLDEMVVAIKGRKILAMARRRCRGYVLDALIQSRRNKKAAPQADAKAPEGPMRDTACHDHR
jgi:putative transposase